ncbi:MAG: segregation/condensation protein A [Candidatus Riflebacteria bacterium]|nr:segregation/condensation protein A [Candidatus Riflebacteria bacterium]
MNIYQVKLPAFEGPFDLLCHMIEEQKINIYDIPIARITEQYLDYIHIMEILDMDVASEFLVMAATLLEIKSKMLLPRDKPEQLVEGDDGWEGVVGDDAREELVNRLVEYTKFKKMALQLRELERVSSRIYTRSSTSERRPEDILQITVTVFDLLNLYQGLVRRRMNPPLHRVVIDLLSLTERVAEIRLMMRLWHGEVKFQDLVKDPGNRYDVVLSFMAVLEMAKVGELEVVQRGNFKPILLHCCEGVEMPPISDDVESASVAASE